MHPQGLLDVPALDELATILGERLATSDAVRDHHGRDESPLAPAPPDAVCWPRTTAEVSAILELCDRRRIPVIPFGAGTSLEGHVLATSGGLCLDLTEMDEIVAVNVADLDAVVGAGVTRKTLNERLARDGLFFSVDPGADATLGGMASSNASGTTTVRYGAMRDNVLALEVVLAGGRVIDTARRARKSSAGYDLTRLFVGSEGTLGVITKVTVRVRGIPESIAGAVCHFPDVDAAVETVVATLQMGVPVARIELLDELAIKAINDYAGLAYPIGPMLLLEFHGSADGVVEDARAVGEIATELGATDYRSAVDNKERTALWRARHDSYYASLALRPGARAITTDVCVPISNLPECIRDTRADLQRSGLLATIVGHAGDGNFHVMMMVDPGDPRELAAADEIGARLVERALALDGTCTGEHGIGLRKKAYLRDELPAAVEVMESVKRALDPNNIMNPGKVLDIS